MSAIKDFFKKKKVEAKFKIAGGGHKLGDAATAAQANAAAAAAAARKQRPEPVRQHPSSSAQQAGAAALNRVSAQPSSNSDEFKKNRQKALIKEQARRELEQEQQMEQEAEKLKQVYGDQEPEEREAPQASPGVFFRCPLVGPEVLPRDEMKARIREFLYSQLEIERGLTAVLIIHTCNSPRERVQTCVDTLCKYLENILENFAEEKFRKIRRSNKAFQERVAALEGTEEFLKDCGFQVRPLAGPEGVEEEFWVLEESSEIDHLAMLQDSLRSCEPLTAELDRGLLILPPGSGGGGSSIGPLPSDFFSLSAEEVKREQQGRAEVLERESMLRTKNMREKESAAGRRKYKYCLVRVRFPDGYILQGTFSVYETLSAVQEFVGEALETPLPFHLIDNATGTRLTQEQASLQGLGLVPASLLNFIWDPDIEADLGATILTFLRTSLTENCPT